MPHGALEGLKKATSIRPNESWWDKATDFLIGEEAAMKAEPVLGSQVLGDIAAELDVLTYPRNDPNKWPYIANEDVKIGMMPDSLKGLQDLGTGIKGIYSRVKEAFTNRLPQADTATMIGKRMTRQAPKMELDYTGISDFLKGKQPTETVSPEQIQQVYERNPLKVSVNRYGGKPVEYPHIPGGQEARTEIQNPPRFPDARYQLPGGTNYTEDVIRLEKPDPTPLTGNWPTYNQEALEELIPLWQAEQVDVLGNDEIERMGNLMREGNADLIEEHLRPIANDAYLGTENEGIDILTGTNPDDPIEGHYKGDFFDPAHFPDRNPLVWVRHNERRIPAPERVPEDILSDVDPIEFGSRGRMIEEVQSPWHQKGRDFGYLTPEAAEVRRQIPMQLDVANLRLRDFLANQYYGMFPTGHPNLSEHNLVAIGNELYRRGLTDPTWQARYQQFRELDDAATAADRAYRASQTSQIVPDAPFKDNEWIDLALKQQLLDVAQDPSLEWVGWTPAEVQKQRYDLSQLISRLAYEHDPTTGKGALYAWDLEGNPARNVWGLEQTPEELEATIGKDAASRLVNKGPVPRESVGEDLWMRGRGGPLHPDVNTLNQYVLEGENLEVGGKGMDLEYDQEIPRRMRKLLEPFGAFIEKIGIPDPRWKDPTKISGYNRPIPVAGQGVSGVVSREGTGEIIANTWPPIAPGAGQYPEARGQADDLARLIQQQFPRGVPPKLEIWLARLSPEVKQQILEKGFPLAMLAAMMGDYEPEMVDEGY